MVNYETRMHPVEFERNMKRLNCWLHKTSRKLAGRSKRKQDDLLQEAAFALWQFDMSTVQPEGLLGQLKREAKRAMTRYNDRDSLYIV